MKQLAQILKALSDPIRLRILLLLHVKGELCVCDVMAVLKLPQSTVSRHLAYLKRHKWVDIRREGVWMHYSLCKDNSDICNELLNTVQSYACNLPEAETDRITLSVFQQTKNAPSCL